MIVNSIRLLLSTFLLHFILLIPFTIHSQDHYEQFTRKDGLPSNECYDTYQDHNGLIWIATDRGLSSFDGNSFKTYGTDEGLPNAVILEFFPQKDGAIWCTTLSNEIFHFHPDTLEFHDYKYNDILKKKVGHQPMDLVLGDDQSLKFRPKMGAGYCKISADGTLHIQTYEMNPGERISVLNWYEGKFPYLRQEKIKDSYNGTPVGNYTNFSSRISQFKSYILVSINNHLILLKKKRKTTITRRIEKVRNILNSGNTNEGFWVGFSNGGVECIDTLGNLVKQYGKDKSVTCYYKDRYGGVWLTTQSSGVLYYPPVKIDHLKNTHDLKIRSLSKGTKGQLIFADNIGHLYELNEDQLIKKNFSTSLPSVQTYEAPWGYYSNEKSFYFYLEKVERWAKIIVMRFSDAINKKPLLIASYSVFNHKHELLYHEEFDRMARVRISDAEYLGKEVIIAKSDTLFMLGSNNSFRKFIALGTRINEFDIHQDFILCATADKGLIILNKNLEIIKTLNSSNGLTSNIINEVLYHNGSIWLGTYKGLARVTSPFTHPKIEVITSAQGLYSDEIFDMEILKDTMYLGTSSGVYFFDLADWSKIFRHQAQINFKIDELLVNGKQVSSLLELGHSENPIEVLFHLYSFEQRSGISFRYKLVGLHNSWKETNDRKIIFQSLPPGEYKLIIQPMFNGIPRNETIRKKISVLPAFYTTWWFLSTIVVVIVVATWLFIHYRVLSYNRELIREILRFVMKRLKPKSTTFVVRSEGKYVRINSKEILYVESNGNYLVIFTLKAKIIIREKIKNFEDLVPDKWEYIRVRRSIIVRKDKINGKNSEVLLIGDKEIKIGSTYKKQVGEIQL